MLCTTHIISSWFLTKIAIPYFFIITDSQWYRVFVYRHISFKNIISWEEAWTLLLIICLPFFHMFSWTLYYWQKNSTDTSLRIWKRFYPCNTYTVPSNKKNILYKYKPHIHSSYIFKQHRSLWVKINIIWLEYYKISFKKWQILKQKSELASV